MEDTQDNRIIGGINVDDNQPEPNALIAQLTQLNERARHYAARIWLVPFAYLGLALIAIGTSWEASDTAQVAVSFGMAAAGILVVIHYVGLLGRSEATVDAIADLERRMYLPAATTKSHLITYPLVVMLIAIIIGLPFAGLFL